VTSLVRQLSFLLILAFWLVMNFLLWRSEFRAAGELGAAVPVAVVWERMLTAPDDSSLEVVKEGRKVGHLRWQPNVGEELRTGKVAREDQQPEGMVTELTGYTIDLEGNLLIDESSPRLRLDAHVEFGANHRWKEFVTRGHIRPMELELTSVAADQTVQFSFDSGGEKWKRHFSFSELRNPANLLTELGGPVQGLLLKQLLPTSLLSANSNWAVGLEWEARQDWLKLGHSRIRVYRLHARLLDKFQIVVLVSRVGEILRVELPNDVVLVNDGLINF
jgi:hypothetical protein